MATEFDTLTSNFTQYVVRPVNAFGLGGFVFDVEGDTQVTLDSDITDHYLEDNSAAQDHIALRSDLIVLKHYVGELVDRPEDGVGDAVERVARKLTTLTQYLPTLSKAAQQIKGIKEQGFTPGAFKEALTSQTVNGVVDYYAFVRNLSGSTSKQQQAYQYLKALRNSKILVSVQTPFEFHTNCAIKNIVAVQEEGSKYVSNFTITLKKIRMASLLQVPEGTVARVFANDEAVNGPLSNQPIRAAAPLEATPIIKQGKAAVQSEVKKVVGIVKGTDTQFLKTIQDRLPPGSLLPPPSL